MAVAGAVSVPQPKATPLMSPQKPVGGRDAVSFGAGKDKRSVFERLNAEPSWVSKQDVAAPYKFWRKATGSPLVSALAAAGLAGAGAYYAAPTIARKVRGMLPGAAQPEMSEDELKRMRNRMALLAALGVGGLSLATHFDPRNPAGSLTNWNYGVKKQAMLSDFSNQSVMLQDVIPMDHAKEIVANDRYLTSGQKAAIGTIFDNTPDQQGNASMADITAGAIRSGLGFAGGAVAGYALGKLFALPASVTRAASLTGGLANALRVSGLIS